MSGCLIETKNLKKYFESKSGALFWKKTNYLKAVDGVSIQIMENETVGLVGESGCGKTTMGRTILRLIEPTSGSIIFKGQDITLADENIMHNLRRSMQIVFQDPISSLNPRMKVEDIVGEPLIVHRLVDKNDVKKQVLNMLEKVGLKKEHLKRYPHEFSGGQKQRISIARALILHPSFLVLDEPTSALDVSVQSEVINLLKRIQKEFNLTYLFISHDLNLVKYVSDRIFVMYLGKIIEFGDSNLIYNMPQHPYTKALMLTNPISDPEIKKDKIILKGEVPSSINLPSGCRFHPRCSIAEPICAKEEPELKITENEHFLACHLRV